jgi:YVTN family beta-propeller protein
MPPYSLAYNPEDGNLYVANTGTNSVSVIDSETNMVVNEI